jgi:hypothetical protein
MFLSMKPLAPARSAGNTYSSRSNVVRTEHAGRRVAVALDERPRRGDPVEPRHADVHQRHVGGGDGEALERLAAVLRLADHRHVGLGVDHHPQPARTSAWSSTRKTRVTPAASRVVRRRRQPGADLVAAARSRPGVHRAAVQRDALAHPGQPVALTVTGGRRAPVVADAQLDLRLEVAQHDLHAPRRDRVPEHVGQRLLGDPMQTRPHPVRQVARRALDLEPDRQAGSGEPPHEAGQVGVLLARPQHAEQPAHLPSASRPVSAICASARLAAPGSRGAA